MSSIKKKSVKLNFCPHNNSSKFLMYTVVEGGVLSEKLEYPSCVKQLNFANFFSFQIISYF